MPDMNQLMAQFQSMMTPYDGPVNWTLAHDSARKIAAQAPDPTPSRADRDRVAGEDDDGAGLEAEHRMPSAS